LSIAEILTLAFFRLALKNVKTSVSSFHFGFFLGFGRKEREIVSYFKDDNFFPVLWNAIFYGFSFQILFAVT